MPRTANAAKNLCLGGLVLLASLTLIPRLVSGETGPTSASHQADQLIDEMRALSARGKTDEAIPIGIRAVTIYEKQYGSGHPRVAATLIELSELYRRTGDHVRAKSLYERTLELVEKGLDSEANAAIVLNGLNFVKRQEPRGQPIEEFFLDRLYDRPLAVPVEEVRRDYPDVIIMLCDIAPSYGDGALSARSQQLLERALKVVERQFSSEALAVTLTDLAEFYITRGDYVTARPFSERALGIVDGVFGRQHSLFAAALNNVAVVCDVDGDYGRAATLYKNALEIAQEDGGPFNPALVIILSNAAIAAWKNRDYPQAIELLGQAAEARERQMQSFFELGFHEDRATALAASLARETNVMISLATEAGGPAVNTALRAVAQNKGRVLDAIVRRVTGRASIEDRPFIAQQVSFNVSPSVQVKSTAPAEPVRQTTTDPETRAARVREMRELIQKRRHLQDRIRELSQSGQCRTQPDACQSEVEKLREVNDAWDLLTSGGDARTLERRRESRRVQEMRKRLNDLRSQGQVDTEEYRALAAEFERLADESSQKRRRGWEERIRQRSQELREVNSRLSDLAVRGLSNTDEYYTLERQRRELEEDISYLREGIAGPEKPSEAPRPGSKSGLAPEGVEPLQQLVPPGAALVEFALYEPFNPAENPRGKPRWGSPRYMAFVLKREGNAIAVDLGEARPIETAVSDLLAGLRRRGTTVTELASGLYDRLFAPLGPHLASAEHVLISPDGLLNLLPFGVLRDAEGRYLVEQKKVTYLTSGRDLVRLANSSPSRQGPIVLADPDFGPLEGPATGSAQRLLSVEQSRDALSFTRLPGTREEALSLKTMLGLSDEQVLTEGRATEAALKHLRGPRILHLATHGFSDMAWSPADGSPPIRQDPPSESTLADSLVRSGLALAGANQRRSGDDDGILTALEVAGLDLAGTELAVLSACETGVGPVQNGEGVYGLRRALMLAGVRMQVDSLWKVDDSATRDLMIDFYGRLLAGTSRSQSLREAQLAMLRDPRRAHPFYWAAFIAIGDDKPMSGW